jgi:predicted Zn finger-like uncharacterized protein
MNATCTHCGTVFRVDPSKVPAGGVRARCSICRKVFRVEAEQEAPAPAPAPPAPAPAAGPGPSEPQPGPPPATPRTGAPFGASDPQAKAKRLARALVSDMVTYHPERRDSALAAGTLKQDFREEIKKSWEEYVEQVGRETAMQTPYFREALNEILARGQSVF